MGFLSSIKLEKYCSKLIDNGVEDLETIMELQDKHIEQMGIPLGHKLKILKRIKDVRAEAGVDLPEPLKIKDGQGEVKYSEGISSRPVTNHDYEELPDPNTN